MEIFKLDDRVKIIGKNISGKIAFIGETHFSEGEWFGVKLDEPKGRNNGSIDGQHYFKCPRNYGIFVRSCQLQKENAQGESDSCSNPKKIFYPNYLANSISMKRESGKLITNSKRNVDSKSQVPKIHPMKTVIEDLKNSLKHKSEEIFCLENQKKEAVDKLKAVKTEKQKLYEELKKSAKKENNLKLEVKSMKNDLMLLKRKLCKIEICLQTSENKRTKLEVTVEELRDITEHAIIEKEIAEEKGEQMEILLKEETDKCKALKIKLDTMREEMKLQSVNGVPAVHCVKKIENENEILKCALLRLKGLYENLHRQFLNSKKEVEKHSNEIEDLKKAEREMEVTLHKYKEETSELYDIIDSMANADDIIFEITERNLKSEDKINDLHRALHDTENLLEVSEETEEILQEIRFTCRDEIECLESKLRYMQTALDRKTILIEEREDIINKYRELTLDLRERNLKLAENLEIISKERKEAVLAAENLKLKIQREKRNATKDLIDKENLKYELDSTKDELGYWLPFMPDDFFKQGGENSAIQVKLIASKILKKLNLLAKLLWSACHDDAESDELKNLALDTKLLTHVYELYGCIDVFIKSSDRIDPAQLLTLNKYHETLEQKNKEIDCCFTSLASGDIDRKYCVNNIKTTCCTLSQLLNHEFATNDERMMTYLTCYLNMIQSICKCLVTYCMALENNHDNSPKFKSGINLVKEKALAFKVNTKSIMNIINNSENQRISLNSMVQERVKNDWKIVQEIMNCIITKYASLIEDNGFTINNFNDKEMLSLNEIIRKSIEVDTDLNELRQRLSDGEYFTEYTQDSVFSPVYSWAQSKRQERNKVISELKHQVATYSLRNAILTESLQRAKHTINKITLTKKDTSQQTDELEYCSGDSSQKTNNYLLTINNMENTIKYLRQKNSELIFASVKHNSEILKPLKVLSKPKYHHDTHSIIALQQRLNQLVLKLKGVLLPQIPDISRQKKSSRTVKYEKYLVQKMLLKFEIENELWNVTVAIKKLKRSPRSVWSETNSFISQNMSFINTMSNTDM